MVSTFLTGVRGTGGRSLAQAMAAWLVVAGCLAALHSGNMAASAVNASVICSANGLAIADTDNSTIPSSRRHCTCCAFGCVSAALSIFAAASDRSADTLPRAHSCSCS